MRIAPLKEVKDRFSEYVEAAQTSPVIVTRNGKPVVVISAIGNESDLDTLFLATNARFIALLEAANARIEDTGGVNEEDFWSKVEEAAGPPAGAPKPARRPRTNKRTARR